MRFDPPLVAILFDLDETLCRTSGYFFLEIAKAALRSLVGGPLVPIRLLLALRAWRRVRESLRVIPRVADLHHAQFRLTADRLGRPLDEVVRFVRPLLYDREFPGLGRHCESGLRETLRVLKGRGLRLGILSDYPVERKLKGMGFDDLGWDVLLCAEDAEALKPQPAPFRLALDRLGLDPDRVLYVGDRPDTDVDGAGALGMRTCLIQRFGRRSARADLVVDRLSLLPSLLD